MSFAFFQLREWCDETLLRTRILNFSIHPLLFFLRFSGWKRGMRNADFTGTLGLNLVFLALTSHAPNPLSLSRDT